LIGGQSCVVFGAINFDSLEGLQFSFSYDPTLLNPIGGNEPANIATSDLMGIQVSDLQCDPITGQCRFVWFRGPENVSENGELFRVCFDLIGDPGQCAEISLNGNGLEGGIELIKSDGSTSVPKITNCCIPINTNNLTIVSGYCEPTSNVAEDGNLHFYATGAPGPFTYTIFLTPPGTSINSGMCNDGEEISLSNLRSGTYSINVVAANGASTSKNIILTDNLPIVFDLVPQDPSCFYINNGTLSVSNIDGGLPPYKISWSNNVFQTNTLSELYNGIYSVEIEDGNGCRVSKFDTLHVDTLKITGLAIDSALCKGVKDGRISLSFSGGTPYANGYQLYLRLPGDAFVKQVGIVPNYEN
jgi:hypothetical protein